MKRNKTTDQDYKDIYKISEELSKNLQIIGKQSCKEVIRLHDELIRHFNSKKNVSNIIEASRRF